MTDLRALLQPRSVAVVGASPRPATIGNTLLRQLAHGGFTGRVHAVNPAHARIEGVDCVGALADLPEPVEHVALAVSDRRVEGLLAEAVAAGARAATVFGSLLDEDGGHGLRDRLRAFCAAHDLLLCGGMSMGFYDFGAGVWMGGFTTRTDHRPGGISLISQSGSAMTAIVDCDRRLDFDLAVSSGLELSVCMEDYLEHALARDRTRVVGLFIETVREPRRFASLLALALERSIPVVVLKVGRSLEAARAVYSHSGALTGSDRALQAVLDRHGAQRVSSLDQLAASLLLFDRFGEVPAGGLVTVHDSGGERGLLLDLAAEAGVPFARLGADTLAGVAARLDGDLPAENPLDAWSTGRDWAATMQGCLADMMADPAAALGALVCDRSPDGDAWPEYHRMLVAVRDRTTKPVCLVANHQGTGPSDRLVAMSRDGVPGLDGAGQFLRGARQLFDWRDARRRLCTPRAAVPPPPVLDGWRDRLAGEAILYEHAALQLLATAGIATVERRLAGSCAAALAAADELGFPVVLKTAAPVAHKTEVDGVRLCIAGAAALQSAYQDLAARLGPEVLVERMLPPGVEMLLGALDDTAHGVLVTLAIGGIHAELLDDTVCLVAPFAADEAARAIDRLRLRGMLAGVRGAAAADVAALAGCAARFSTLAAALAGCFTEFDVNPLLVHARGCVAADALLIGRRSAAMSYETGVSTTPATEVQSC